MYYNITRMISTWRAREEWRCFGSLLKLSNRPFPNYLWPFFKASPGAHLFIWKLVFICMWMKANLHMKRWAPGLALKRRPKVIRKWPIMALLTTRLCRWAWLVHHPKSFRTCRRTFPQAHDRRVSTTESEYGKSMLLWFSRAAQAYEVQMIYANSIALRFAYVLSRDKRQWLHMLQTSPWKIISVEQIKCSTLKGPQVRGKARCLEEFWG